jgi:hypothetical protein
MKHDNIIFVSFEQGGGGHRFARTIAALDCIYWYSHPDNGVQPWNIHFEHSNIRQRYAAKAHFDRIVPKGKLPPTWDYVSNFFPDEDAYYKMFFEKFEELAPDTDKKFIYCTHSTPQQLRKHFPKSKIFNMLQDINVLTDRYLQTSALFPGWLRMRELVDEDNEYLVFLKKIKEKNPNFLLRDIWAMLNYNKMYDTTMDTEYRNHLYNRFDRSMYERFHYTDLNTYRIYGRSAEWRDVKFFLLSQE